MFTFMKLKGSNPSTNLSDNHSCFFNIFIYGEMVNNHNHKSNYKMDF